MRVAAAVLTYRTAATGRLAMCARTVQSLGEADIVVLADNGSDESWLDGIGKGDVQTFMGVRCDRVVTHQHPCHTSGFGTNFAARHAIATGADLVVLSDDDMFWRPGWRQALEAWWNDTPPNLILTGCHLEPMFPWNKLSGVVEHGGVRGVLRESTGAATWSFRSADWSKIGPIPSRVQGWGDVPACMRVRAHGYQIAQVDLAEHRGHGRSTWGNTTVDQYGWDVEPVRALLGASCASA